MKRRSILEAAGAAALALTGPASVHAASEAQPAKPWILTLWHDGQAGERLEIRGTVTNAAKVPLAGAQVHVRHAGPSGDYTGQYQGSMTTDTNGRYVLRTAMPGNYGRPKHIHVEAFHSQAGHAYTEIVFKGDPMLSPESQQYGIVLETVRLGDNTVLVGEFPIVLSG